MELSLEQRIERVEANSEIQNIMGKYSHWLTAHKYSQCLGLFALNTPGVKVEMMWGAYEGKEGLKRCYLGFHEKTSREEYRGVMAMHNLTTPVIEVADDLQTAKAVWVCPGHETLRTPEGLKAHWAWMKYGSDFIKEEGKWKIWPYACVWYFSNSF
ncbi:MAG: nuclear transport factor 2 family protein [Firmicutes bacterium]|nr:nuclear transport factor 2 family protein [Bacillota bacterium]